MYFKDYPFFISLPFLLIHLLIAHDFTNEQWEKLENYAPKRLIQKLKKTIDRDYDDEYREKYLSKRHLVKDRVAKKIAAEVEGIEQLLLAQAQLDAKKTAQYHAVKQKVGSRIASESFPGIWFKDENTNLLTQENDNRKVECATVVAAVKKCMPLFDINSIVINTSSTHYTDMGIEPMSGIESTNSIAITGDELPCLSYSKDYIAHIYSNQQEIDAVIAHECAHAKFRHGYYFPEYLNCRDAYHTLIYYQEKQADTHASLTLALQTESFFRRQLKISLRENPLFNMGIKDNDPIKGHANKDEHPSYLLRYIYALKIRKLLEAEQRWFNTEEANERYGSVYYERAWQKWAEQQAAAVQSNVTEIA